MSKNFAKTDEALKRLALKRVKEKKHKKKVVKDNNRLWRIARCLKVKNKMLKAKLVTFTPLQMLAETTENLGVD